MALLSFPDWQKRWVVYYIEDDEWEDNYSYDADAVARKESYFTWQPGIDWATVFTMEDLHARVMRQYRENFQAQLFENKVWMALQFCPKHEIPGPPTLYAMGRDAFRKDEFYSRINCIQAKSTGEYVHVNDVHVFHPEDDAISGPRKNPEEDNGSSNNPNNSESVKDTYAPGIPISSTFWEGIEAAVDSNHPFLLKPAHLASGTGIFYFDQRGTFTGKVGHLELEFLPMIEQGFKAGAPSMLSTDPISNVEHRSEPRLARQIVGSATHDGTVQGTGEALLPTLLQSFKEAAEFLRSLPKFQIVTPIIPETRSILLRIAQCILTAESKHLSNGVEEKSNDHGHKASRGHNGGGEPGILVELFRPQDELRVFIGLNHVWGHQYDWGGQTGHERADVSLETNSALESKGSNGAQPLEENGRSILGLTSLSAKEEVNEFHWTKAEYDAAIRLAKHAARCSGVDLVRVDVGKYGKELLGKIKELQQKKEGGGKKCVESNSEITNGCSASSATDESTSNTTADGQFDGVFLSEFTLITYYTWEGCNMEAKMIYQKYFRQLKQFWDSYLDRGK